MSQKPANMEALLVGLSNNLDFRIPDRIIFGGYRVDRPDPYDTSPALRALDRLSLCKNPIWVP